MPLAAVALQFDPVLRLSGFAIRLETLALALVLAVACVVGALVARRTPVDPDNPWSDRPTLRAEDLVFIVLAALPGGVIGGRLGYALLHLDYYLARPAALFDPGQGSLELSLGVAGAAVTGGFAARLLTGRSGPWFHAAAFPTLLLIAGGKLAMALGGSGQGAPDDGAWATAYLGSGPWGSLAPATPSHPSQLYEAAAAGIAAVALVGAFAAGAFRRADGSAWFVAVAAWGVGRIVVASTWRDAPVLGPLNAGQLLALALTVLCVAAVAALRSSRRAGTTRGSIVTTDHDRTSRAVTDPALHGSEERT